MRTEKCLLFRHADIFRKLKNLDGLMQVKKAPGNLFTFAFKICIFVLENLHKSVCCYSSYGTSYAGHEFTYQKKIMVLRFCP